MRGLVKVRRAALFFNQNKIVLGAGALGLVLAHELVRAEVVRAAQPQGRSPGSTRASSGPASGGVLIFNRRPLPQPVRVEAFNASDCLPPEDFTLFLDSQDEGTPRLAFADGSDPLTVFACSVPGTEKHLLERFFASVDIPAARVVDIVLCGNGLVPDDVASHCAALPTVSHLRFRFFRALFFVGFMREEDAAGTRARHTGGTRVEWGPWESAPQGEPESSNHEKGRGVSSPLIACPDVTPHLHWVESPFIAQVEYCKFFVNLSLALGNGPGLKRNAELDETLPFSERALLAEALVAVAPEPLRRKSDAGPALSVALLLSRLADTVTATAANVNSISLAGARGDHGLFQAFWAMAWTRAQACGDPAVRAAWNDVRRTHAAKWGLT